MSTVIVDKAELGDRLYQLRHRRHWTLAEVERQTGLPQSTVSRWERGTGKGYPELDRLATLAKLYGATVAELIGEDWPTRARDNAESQRPAA